MNAWEKLKGMKYSTIKNCGEFLISRIRHLYTPWKERELEGESERERQGEREMINERQGREGWIVSAVVSKSLRNTLSEQFFGV